MRTGSLPDLSWILVQCDWKRIFCVTTSWPTIHPSRIFCHSLSFHAQTSHKKWMIPHTIMMYPASHILLWDSETRAHCRTRSRDVRRHGVTTKTACFRSRRRKSPLVQHGRIHLTEVLWSCFGRIEKVAHLDSTDWETDDSKFLFFYWKCEWNATQSACAQRFFAQMSSWCSDDDYTDRLNSYRLCS